MTRDTVRKIAAGYGHGYYVDKARAGEKTTELWTELGEKGFLGINIPQAYGGGGMGITELAIVSEELSAVGCPLMMLVVSPGVIGSILSRHGTDEQKQTWLPGMATAKTKMAFALTEPDAGSNLHNLSTVAKRDGDNYRISGSKCYISGADEANAILVVARTEKEDSEAGRISLFIVDPEAHGLDISVIPMEIVAPEKQCLVFLDDVVVGPDRLVGTEPDGLRQLFTGLNPERITVAAIGNGIGLYALRKAAGYARERKVWNDPIGAHQGLSHPLAKAKIEVELARLMTAKAGWLFDAGLDAAEAANICKYAAAEAALTAMDQAIQIHGGSGLASEYGLSDLWGMTRILRTAPVSREMILNFVARHSLGLPKSY